MDWKNRRWVWPVVWAILSVALSYAFSMIQWLLIGSPIAVLFLIIQHDTKVVSQILANRIKVDICSIFLAIILAEYFIIVEGKSLQFTPYILPFGILGIVLGALFRRSIGMMIYQSVTDKPNLGAKAAAAAIWTTIILFFPVDSLPEAIPHFIFGIALGISIHKIHRYWHEKQVAGFRRLEDAADIMPKGDQAVKKVRQALVLLYDGLDKELRQLLNEERDVPVGKDFIGLFAGLKQLALISAVLYRNQGKYDEVIKEVDNATGGKIREKMDAHLIVIKALCLEDLGNMSLAEETIDLALKSDYGKGCAFTHSTKAMRVAEHEVENALFKKGKRAASTEALKFAHEALRLRRKEAYRKIERDFWATEIVARNVPLSSTMFLDVLGYSYLAAGHWFYARCLMEQCITMDPSYIAAYLHLGDYFLLRKRSEKRADQMARYEWHAELCYRVALESERNPSSKISMKAIERLNGLQKL